MCEKVFVVSLAVVWFCWKKHVLNNRTLTYYPKEDKMTTLIILVLSAVVIGAVIRMFIAPITGYVSTGTGMATATIIAIVFVILALCWCGGHYNNNVNAAGMSAARKTVGYTAASARLAARTAKKAASATVNAITIQKETVITNYVPVYIGI